MSIIRLHRVDKRFASGLLALRQVNLQVEAGEFVSLLGPSGCGKSTVLRLAAGLETATTGEVQSPALADSAGTAFVFQEAALMPWARVFDNVWLPLRLAGVSRAEAAPRVREALRSVGLQDFEASRPAELSGGMKMRASIARALVIRPELLLMDEPFGALDDITRQRLNLDLLARWQAARMAVLFVTHSVFEAVFLSRRVLVMSPRPGRVVAEVAIDEPYPRTAAFRHAPDYLAACARVGEALAATQEDAA